MLGDYAKIINDSVTSAIDKRGVTDLALRLFELFFAQYPEAREYFKDTDIRTFAPQKFTTIAEFFVDTIEHPEFAKHHVSFEVYRHISYDVKDAEYYYTMVDVFQQVITEAMEDLSDADTQVWNEVATAMKSYLQHGARLYL
jgi:hemoglobin-like flavoprotein